MVKDLIKDLEKGDRTKEMLKKTSLPTQFIDNSNLMDMLAQRQAIPFSGQSSGQMLGLQQAIGWQSANGVYPW